MYSVFVFISIERRKFVEWKNLIMESLKEIQQFLTIETPQHVKSIAITYVLSKFEWISFLFSKASQKFFFFRRFDWFQRGTRTFIQK